jgi:hypothetical protein
MEATAMIVKKIIIKEAQVVIGIRKKRILQSMIAQRLILEIRKR